MLEVTPEALGSNHFEDIPCEDTDFRLRRALLRRVHSKRPIHAVFLNFRQLSVLTQQTAGAAGVDLGLVDANPKVRNSFLNTDPD
ncbi:unnamed protein product [Mesocestoides corti]|nr:unnamed protein product [Mesocestoides corti]